MHNQMKIKTFFQACVGKEVHTLTFAPALRMVLSSEAESSCVQNALGLIYFAPNQCVRTTVNARTALFWRFQILEDYRNTIDIDAFNDGAAIAVDHDADRHISLTL